MMLSRASLAVPVVLCTATAACVPVAQQSSQPRMTEAEAETLCTKRARQYAQSPRLIPDESGTIQVGLQAETPDDFMIRDYYRSCYRANAGVWPDTIPDIPSFS